MEEQKTFLFYMDVVRPFSIVLPFEFAKDYFIRDFYPKGLFRRAYSARQAREYMKRDIAKRFNVKPSQVWIELAFIDLWEGQ